MPRRRRRRTAISGAAVADRARWAGLLGEPELTPEEQRVLRVHRRGTWVPQHALHLLWNCYDVHHGDPWSLSAFSSAVGADVAEIDRRVAEDPSQRDRLARWVREVEALGVERESDPGAHGMGEVYRRLGDLGYHGGR